MCFSSQSVAGVSSVFCALGTSCSLCFDWWTGCDQWHCRPEQPQNCQSYFSCPSERVAGTIGGCYVFK